MIGCSRSFRTTGISVVLFLIVEIISGTEAISVSRTSGHGSCYISDKYRGPSESNSLSFFQFL